MPLKEKFMLKTVLGNTPLELRADSGEAFLIKDILVYNPATSYLTVICEKATVGFFRVGGILGSHLPCNIGRGAHAHDVKLGTWAAAHGAGSNKLINAGDVETAIEIVAAATLAGTHSRVTRMTATIHPQQKTLLKLLSDLNIFKGYPVPEGYTFKLSGAAQTGAIQIVIYEIYDPADITPEMENGPASKSYFFVNYGNCGAAVNIDGDSVYKVTLSPAEFPDFPFAAIVPAKTKIELLALLSSDFAPKENDATNYTYTRYLKMVRGRETLFDEDKNGILHYAPFATSVAGLDMVAEGQSLVGNFSNVDHRPPLVFPEPLIFEAGEELSIFLNTLKAGTGQNIAIDEHEIGLIEKILRE